MLTGGGVNVLLFSAKGFCFAETVAGNVFMFLGRCISVILVLDDPRVKVYISRLI